MVGVTGSSPVECISLTNIDMNVWSEKDKQLHFFVSMVLYFLLSIFNAVCNLNMNVLVTFLIIFLIGVCKEVYDYFFNGTPSYEDIVANTIGILVGMLIHKLVITVL